MVSDPRHPHRHLLRQPWQGLRPHNPANALAPNAVWEFPLTSGQFQGSAIVSGVEDLSVVVANRHNDAYTGYSGIPSHNHNPGWGSAATSLRAPTVKRNLGGRTTDLYLLNVGPAVANVTIKYYDNAGTEKLTQTCTLNPLGTCRKRIGSGSNQLWNAVITANQPLVGLGVEGRHASNDHTQVSTHSLI